MFRNVKNIRLIAVLVILIIAYAGLRLLKNTSRSKSFREELVVIDTTKVNRIIITKSGESFEVSRADDQWKVTLAGNKKVDATSSSVNNALGSLLQIKPDRIIDLIYKSPQKVEEVIINLSDIYRKVLNLPDNQPISLKEEIKFLDIL